MDYEKYYKLESNGSYSLHFFNVKDLNMDELRKIFSSYGNITSIKIGDTPGLRFVKYNTLEETMRCLKGLHNSNIIQILPEKSKMNGSCKKIDQSNSSQWQSRTENSSQRTFKHGKQFNPKSAHNENISEIGGRSAHNMRTSVGDNVFNNADNSDINPRNSKYGHKPNENAIKYDKSDPSISNGKRLLSRQQNSVDNNSSNTATEYEKYYRIGKDGNYTVHFANKKGLSSEEIRDLFSPYGDVIAIYTAGNDNGLRIIKYKTLDETIKCLQGLQNNNMIFMLPQKNNSTSKKDQDNSTFKEDQDNSTFKKNSNQWQLTRMEDSSKRRFNIDKQFNSNSIHDEKFSKAGKKLIHNKKSDWDDRFDNTDNCSDTGSGSSKHGYNVKINAINPNKLDPEVYNGKHLLFPRQQNSVNDKASKYDQSENEQMKSYASTKFDVDTYISDDNKMPALISDTEIKQKESDVMSDSSSSIETKYISSKIIVIPMQEVIVANIHKNYGIHYILHLFEKHNPISATFMNTISETNIRYCHIYFKTIQDAVTVEEEFDNFDLAGKNLIVLRKSQLMKEATCK